MIFYRQLGIYFLANQDSQKLLNNAKNTSQRYDLKAVTNKSNVYIQFSENPNDQNSKSQKSKADHFSNSFAGFTDLVLR